MRKLFLVFMVLGLLLAAGAAMADAREEQIASAASEALTALCGNENGWIACMAERAVISVPVVSENSCSVTVTWPRLVNPVGKGERPGSDPGGYLARCLQPFAGGGATSSFTLEGTIGDAGVSWKKGHGPSGMAAAMKKDASAAKKSYDNSRFRSALTAWLFPKAVDDLPSEQPKELPEIGSLPELGTEVADALGISADAAAWRLPPFLLNNNVASFDLSDPRAAVLTLRTRNMEETMERGLEAGKKLISKAVAAPQMTFDEVSVYLGRGMSDQALRAFYHGKVLKKRITIDLTVLTTQGRGSQDGYTAYLKGFLADSDDEVRALMSYAADLPFYPEMDIIASQLLSGSADASGTLVTIDLGNDTRNNAYLQVYRDNRLLFTAFVSGRMHLRLPMRPGSYTVRYGKGENWFGTTYLFAESGEYGSFDLTIPDTEMAALHLNAAGDGNLAATPLSWEDLRE